MAEFVFKDMVKKQKIENEFYIESAATSFEAVGSEIYSGTIQILNEMKIPYDKNKRARRITIQDYEKFDYILGMENSNIQNIKRIVGEDKEHKIYRLLDFSENPRDISDPWYTGDFEITYNDIVEGCNGFIKYLDNTNIKK